MKLSIKVRNVKTGVTEGIDSHFKQVISIRSRIKEHVIMSCIHNIYKVSDAGVP
jgi:hypothetical protein